MRLLFCALLLPFLVMAQELDYSVSAIPEELKEGADAVVKLDKLDVYIESIKNMEASLRRVVTVFNEAGNQHVRGVVGYSDGIKVKNVNATVYDAEGNIIEKIKQKDFVDVSAVDGGSLYSDSRMLYMSYFPIQYPYTVHFEYEIVTNNTGTIPEWYFLDDFKVGVQKSIYSVSYGDSSLKPIIKEKNLEGHLISKIDRGNSVTYIGENIPAAKDEVLRPSRDDIMPRLLVAPVNFYYEGYKGTIKDWKDAGDWMKQNILSGQGNLEPKTIAIAQKLTDGMEDDLEKAKKIYEYIQENTRYISVQVGIGGIKPISAIEVDNVKYGDCKGLANYTQALLKSVGVTSYYVHVEAGYDKVDFENDVASLAQGNHVILALPYQNNYYWLDCTSQTIPFGFIGDFTDDRKVLVIKPDGGELVKTISYPSEGNLQKTEGNYILNDEGDVEANVEITTMGIQYGDHYLLSYGTNDDIEKYYKSYWNNINNLHLKGQEFFNDKENIAFNEKVKFNADKYGILSDGKMIFVANAFNNPQFIPPRYRNRKFPFEVQRGFLDEDTYTIEIPKNYVIEAMPKASSLESSFGSYNIEFEDLGNGKILYRRKLLIKEGKYSSTEYESYRKFMREIAKKDNSKIILINTTRP